MNGRPLGVSKKKKKGGGGGRQTILSFFLNCVLGLFFSVPKCVVSLLDCARPGLNIVSILLTDW